MDDYRRIEMIQLMKLSWWALLLRGISALLFGLLALVWPGITLEVLILFFGAYALVDGVLTGAAALANRKHDSTWWLFLLAGLIGIAAGVLTFLLPAVTELVLVYLIAARALIVGLIEIVYAFALRREIQNEWFYILNGVLSLVFGVLLFIAPGEGALALVTLIGVFALIGGGLLLVVSIRMRKLLKQLT
jgi:uncharacterized membrane protein HdeD (DUF308 family)